MFLPADHPAFPFSATLIGGYIMISIYCWCQNQTIVERTLAVRSDWESVDGIDKLRFGQVIANVTIDVVPIVANACRLQFRCFSALLG